MIAGTVTRDVKNDDADNEQTNHECKDLHPSWSRRFDVIFRIVARHVGHRINFPSARGILSPERLLCAVTLANAGGAGKRAT